MQARKSMLRILSAAALIFVSQLAFAAEVDIVGTYRLISANRVILETGETEDSWGKNPVGWSRWPHDGDYRF